MSFLQGNTYLKPIQVLDDSGKVVKADKVVKGEFTIGDICKYYGEGGDVQWSVQENAFIVPLTEEDTFSLKPDTTSEVQVRLLLDDGSVSGSLIEKHYVYRTKSKTRLTESGAGERNGEILKIKLLKELGTGGSGGTTDYNYLDNKPSINGVELIGNKTTQELGIVSEETDPTVPQHVKSITEQNIESWNNKAEKSEIPTKVSQLANDEKFAKESYVDTKIADLVGSAPETRDTIEEVAKAIQENESVISALNSAIGEKANKSELPTKTSDLVNDSGFITEADIPEVDVDLSNYYTKDETYSKAEVNALFGSSGEELLKVSPVVTESVNASAETPYPEAMAEFKNESGANYCPQVTVGTTYVVEYKVDGVTYRKEDVAIDLAFAKPDAPQGIGFSLGMNVSGEQVSASLIFTSAEGNDGAIIIQGIFQDNYSIAVAQMMESGVNLPSVELVSIREKGESKYYTKAETEAYVQEQIANSITSVLNTEV